MDSIINYSSMTIWIDFEIWNFWKCDCSLNHTFIWVLPFLSVFFAYFIFYPFFPRWKPHNLKDIIGCLNFYFWRCSECRQSIVKLFFTFLTPCWVMCIGHDAFFKRSLTDTLCIPMNDLALKNLFFLSILSLFFDKPSPSLSM